MTSARAKKPARREAQSAAAPPHVVTAEMTIYRAAELRQELLLAFAAGARHFDLGGVTEVDSAGLQLLLALRRSAQSAGVTCRFEPVSEAVRSLAALFDVETILCAKA